MTRRPYVLIFSTMTLDGRIASSTHYSLLSCCYDKARLLLLRGMVNAVMVGAGTVLVDNPRLVKRLKPQSSKYYRVVVDGKLRINAQYRLFSTTKPPVIVFTSPQAPRERIEELRSRGAIVYVTGEGDRVDLKEALRILYDEHGVETLLVEGGGILNYNLLRERLADEVRLTITPYVFGAGVSVFRDSKDKGFTDTKSSPKLRLKCFEKCPCGNCIHIVYSVEDSACCPPPVNPPPSCLGDQLARVGCIDDT